MDETQQRLANAIQGLSSRLPDYTWVRGRTKHKVLKAVSAFQTPRRPERLSIKKKKKKRKEKHPILLAREATTVQRDFKKGGGGILLSHTEPVPSRKSKRSGIFYEEC